MQTITIGSNSYNLVALPTTPGPAAVEIGMNDTVAVSESPFTRQQQTQTWSGGDWWDATVTLPPMTLEQAAAWRGFLAELRGRANVFQLADPSASPAPTGNGAPTVSGATGVNLPMTTSLWTVGWTPNAANILLPGQQFQVGYRLYSVCEACNADSSGNCTIPIWPSLRETPASGAALILSGPMGLFRLARNRRPLQWSPSRLVQMSFACEEVR